jgi:hypothetical protein
MSEGIGSVTPGHGGGSASGSHGYHHPAAGSGRSLVKIGGALGVAATFIGFAIFVVGCFGYAAVFGLSIIPLVLGGIGLGLVIAGGFFQQDIGVDDMSVVASYCITLAAIAGAGLLVAVWRGWPIFFK